MSDIPIRHSRHFRAQAVANAVNSSLLEGVQPSAQTMERLSQYVEGHVTIKALIADAKRRHSRTD